MGLACVLVGFGVYKIIYMPVYKRIHLFGFIATDILAGLGLGLDGMMIFVLGAHACARACAHVRVYACACTRERARARNYGFILVLCLASILFFCFSILVGLITGLG